MFSWCPTPTPKSLRNSQEQSGASCPLKTRGRGCVAAGKAVTRLQATCQGVVPAGLGLRRPPCPLSPCGTPSSHALVPGRGGAAATPRAQPEWGGGAAGRKGRVADCPPSLPSFLGASGGVVCTSSALGPAPPPPPARGLLTSRHAGAHHGAAGPGRCALSASGRRAIMSPQPGAHAWRGRRGRAGREGAGVPLGSAASQPGPHCRRRRCLPRQLLPAPRIGVRVRGGGAADRSPGTRSAEPREGARPFPALPHPGPPPRAPVVAAGLGAGRGGGAGD